MNTRLNKRFLASLLAPLLAAIGINSAFILPSNSCTDFLVKTSDGTKIVGRSMEWGADLKSHVWKYPKGQSRSSQTPDGSKALSWQSKYGYLAVDANNMPLAIDGMNEQGLSVGMLWMPGAVYQDVAKVSPSNTISLLDLDHWLLGSFTTVAEVKEAIAKVMVWAPQMAEWGGTPTAHLAIHDATGASAVIEFVDGQQKIYDNQASVLTNAPTFDWHKTNLNNYVNISASNAEPIHVRNTVLAPPGQGGGFLGIPGDWTPPSRFVRTAAMLGFAKPVANAKDGIDLTLHILNAVDIPLGDVRQADNQIDHSDYTQWVLIKDLTNRVLHFRSYDNLTVRAIDMKKLNFNAGTKPEKLTPIAGGKAVVELTF
ncbi:MAG: linear amide C-N hydrolase [Candidatus Obscuribacterales bacterium]